MKKLLYLFSILLGVSACNSEFEEVINWKLGQSADLLVVESVITNEYSHQLIRLTITSQYFDTMPPRPVTGAEVGVFEGDNYYNFLESDSLPGRYFSEMSFSGQPLKTYHMEVKLPAAINGITDYSADSRMPEGIDLDSALFYLYEMPEFDFYEDETEERDTTILGIYFFGKEPLNEENYYINKVYRNNKPLHETSKDYYIYSDEGQNGDYVHLSGFIDNIQPNDTILFEIFSIEKSFYRYLDGIKNADQSGGMGSMSGPPANALGNIENGKGLGYFGTAYVSRKTGEALDMRK